MGWIVWFLDTVLCIAAAYLVAVATYPDRGTVDRLVVTLLVTPALILLDIQACGIAGHFEGGPLTLVGGVLFGGVGAIAFRAAGLATVRTTLRSDLTAPCRLVADVWGEKEPAILTLAPAGMALFVVCRMVWYFKSWTWDPVWYHVPITNYVIQNRSLDWFDTHELFAQGYARNVELLAAWNCVFQHDNRLDESSQLPFAILGVCVLAAWARRLGSSRPMALAVGAAWYALPPVFLESLSTHVDVAVGALFPAAMYFASAAPERELRAGDVVTYDESAHFLAEFWCRDYRTRVTFVSSAGNPAGYVRRLRTLRARWVGVSGGSSAETAVREAGGVWLFGAPGSSVQLYRMPRDF